MVLANAVPGRASGDRPSLEPAGVGETSPTPNLTIAFRALSSGESYATPVSSDGRFSFRGELPAGSYEVGFSLSDDAQVSSLEATGATAAGRTLEVSAERPVTLVVHMVEIGRAHV